MDSVRFHELVTAKAAELKAEFYDYCYITSVENVSRGTRPGIVSQTSVQLGARHLVEATHRLATQDEINSFLGVKRVPDSLGGTKK